MKLPPKNLLIAGIGGALALLAIIYFATLPVAEVAVVQRGTAISAVYGTVRIEPTLVIPTSSPPIAPTATVANGLIRGSISLAMLPEVT